MPSALGVGVLADDEAYCVEPSAIRHRHQVTPYAGARLVGRVHATYLRGARIYDGAEVDGVAGQLL